MTTFSCHPPHRVGPLGGFLGVLGGLLGALWDKFGLQLGRFVPSWVGSLVKQIWASVGWLCLPWGQVWLLFGIWFVNQVFLSYLWRPLVEFVDIGEAGLDLGWVTILVVEYVVDHIFRLSLASKVFMAPLLGMSCIYWQGAVIPLQTFKFDWCSLGIVASYHH